MVKIFCDACGRNMCDSQNFSKDAGRILISIKGLNGAKIKCIEAKNMPLGNDDEGDVCKDCILEAFKCYEII